MGNPVMFFEIAGKDGGSLRDFYTALFSVCIKISRFISIRIVFIIKGAIINEQSSHVV